MEGYIDIHSHILPGFDDGSRSIEQTMSMAEIAQMEDSCNYSYTSFQIRTNYALSFRDRKVFKSDTRQIR